MLILARRIGEGVLIGDGIRVVILEVRGQEVCVGIEAPLEIVVLRDEIFQRLNRENHLAVIKRQPRTPSPKMVFGPQDHRPHQILIHEDDFSGRRHDSTNFHEFVNLHMERGFFSEILANLLSS